MPPTPNDAEIARIARELYRGGPRLLATLNRLRPYICPFGPLIEAVPPGSTVLDVGCGGGLYLGLLARLERISSGVGFDSNRRAVDLANQMAEGLPRGAALSFLCVAAGARWPVAERPDVVSLIDVMHHIPPGDQKSLLERAALAVRPGGRLIYKDMAQTPVWRAAANRLHDLILSRQWIHYLAMDRAVAWAEHAGLRLIERRRIDRYCYGHELAVFERPDEPPRAEERPGIAQTA